MKTIAYAHVGVLIVLACACPTVSAASATVVYLEGGGVPVATLSTAVPVATSLPNHDPLRNSLPGLVIKKNGIGIDEVDPTKYHQWVGPSGGMTLEGPYDFVFWAAMKSFLTGQRGIVKAYLLDCEPGGSNCTLIAEAQTDILDWGGGWGTWSEHSIEFGDILYTVPQGRSLSLKVVAGGDSSEDMWFAYGSTAFPSRVTNASASDVVIDCDFADWTDGSGTEFNLYDQGGADDWASPAKLDVTWFAVSSNLVDAFQILVGIDDLSPRGSTAATLLDTDLDNKVDYALVATVDGASAIVDLYACDDSLSDGCGSASLARSYPSSSFCMGVGAGPWNQDTLLEISLPFDDLGHRKDSVILLSWVSYAGASFLTSPKDSILGASSQEYAGRIHFDTTTGAVNTMGQLGSSFLVRRHTDPAAVRTAAPIASVTAAPFDDGVGSLDDGVSYFYVLERDGGLRVRLSTHSNPIGTSVRLGFADDDPLNAPVDGTRSTVTLNQPVLTADGASYSFVVVTPRDGDGVPVGSGCDVSMDPVALSPGTLAVPAKDNLDGSYTFKVLSSAGGSADVVINVEGIVLVAQPGITYSAP